MRRPRAGRRVGKVSKSEGSRIIGIVLCERVSQDILRRETISLINIYHGIYVQNFPAVIPLIFAFAQLTGSHREFTYQFRIVDRQGQIIANSPVAKVEPVPNRNMIQKVISAFQGLTFHEEGMYNIVLSLDGEDVGSSTFQVMQITPEAVC